MDSYHQNLANATVRAYQQVQSITGIATMITRAITSFTVADAPDSQKLLDEANEDLDQAFKQVESAQRKVALATRAVKDKDGKIAAMVGHAVETIEQLQEHENYAANVATLAKGSKVLQYDEEFMTWLLNGADEVKLNQAMEKLSHHRLGTILLNSLRIANGPQLKWASLQMDEAKRNLITEIFQDILKDSEE